MPSDHGQTGEHDMAITVYYATNRNETGTAAKPDFGPNFHQKGPEYLRFGSAEVALPAKPAGDYKVTSVYLAPEQIPGVTSKKGAKKVLGSREIFEELRVKMKTEKSDLILLIHGYSSDFRTALERAAQLKQEYAGVGRPVEIGVFSWPADGDMTPWLSYYRDRDDAKASGIAIARAFLKLLDYFAELDKTKFCWQRLHLVAHSMGNYALRHALQGIIAQYPGKILPRVIQNVFLMAADEDNDALELDFKLARLPELAEAVHIYYSATDGALSISDSTKGNPDRLGSAGPRTLTNLPHKITLVDCRNVDETSPLTEVRHQYYRKRPEVIADVRQVLAGVPPDKILDRDYIPEKRSYRIRAK
jgi:esterase/lipase superfamily enzyme